MNLAVGIGWDQVSELDRSRQSILSNRKADHHVESQQGEIVEVILG